MLYRLFPGPSQPASWPSLAPSCSQARRERERSKGRKGLGFFLSAARPETSPPSRCSRLGFCSTCAPSLSRDPPRQAVWLCLAEVVQKKKKLIFEVECEVKFGRGGGWGHPKELTQHTLAAGGWRRRVRARGRLNQGSHFTRIFSRGAEELCVACFLLGGPAQTKNSSPWRRA